ncbi:hypothetical protein SAMN02745724_04454 [Pseudoalteromonas denitrificans DSM 6059]|uniref:Uncharacterized protein n=2 Tax=Pseudoalteromonas TaxID=53246 RepID=A0A1I1S4R6_9GAMM|nr:hypothetical protein SAMN02745724_04454 [Pseudoalteromonas denitrificans DSM 6059]
MKIMKLLLIGLLSYLVLYFCFLQDTTNIKYKIDEITKPNIKHSKLPTIHNHVDKKVKIKPYSLFKTIPPAKPSDSLSNQKPYVPKITKSKISTQYTGNLNDHDEYLKFELEQNQIIKRSFINATTNKVKHLNKLIKRAELEGMSEYEIEFAKDKIKALQTLKKQLKRELKTEL